MFRICFVIYSGFMAAKVQLFCDICKIKVHFLSEKVKKLPKLSGYMKEKHRRYPLNRQNRDNMTDAMVEPSSRGERTAPAPSGHLPMSEPTN